MADHKKVLEHVKSHEGGYSADPRDNASSDPSPIIGLDKRYPSLPVHTYRGVTWRTWKNYSRAKGMAVSADKFVGMSLSVWEDLLKSLYWDSILGDQIKSQGAAELIFEAVWGGGATRFNSDLQTYLQRRGYDIKADGVIGPKTVAALNAYTKSKKNEEDLILHMTNKRLEYLQSLDDWATYRKGWSSRLAELKDRALSYLNIIKKDPKISGLGLLAGAAAVWYLLKD